MDKETLVETLKKQHKGLQADLSAVAGLVSGADISSGLVKFKNDLIEHLNLENGTFYAELLKKMKDAGQDTKDTEAFIESMNDIAKVVMAFLEKYSVAEHVNNNIDAFIQETGGIIKAFNVRIESEEEGVYEIFLTL